MPEIRSAGLKVPVILVGTQSDLRTDVKVCRLFSFCLVSAVVSHFVPFLQK